MRGAPRLPENFTSHDVKTLQNYSDAKALLYMNDNQGAKEVHGQDKATVKNLQHYSDAKALLYMTDVHGAKEVHGHGKARGTAHRSDKPPPHIHPEAVLKDNRPESFTKKKHPEIQNKVGHEYIAAHVYSANHDANVEAQRMRRLQHSTGSGDILAMHDGRKML